VAEKLDLFRRALAGASRAIARDPAIRESMIIDVRSIALAYRRAKAMA